MGIRRNEVTFEKLPSAAILKSSLISLTGLNLVFSEKWPDQLDVEHPQYSNCAVDIDWFYNENIHFRISSETPNFNYIEASCLFLLKQLGGDIKNNVQLPSWAGKKWVDVWPKTLWGRIKARWFGHLLG